MARRSLSRLLGLFLLAVVAGLWFTRPQHIEASAVPEREPDLANGERMFGAGGCASCHAAKGAKGDDKLVLQGGLELKSPFGLFRVPNISTSNAHGIGGWSTADFITAMVKGTSPDGRHYYPAFPYASYQKMRYGDLIDLKAFLDTLPASDNEVGGHDLMFPYSIRPGVGVWKLLYLSDQPFEANPDWDATTNLGAYLATGPGHCAECHTPRDIFGGLNAERWMAGAPDPEGGKGRIPNITPHADGIGNWSAADIAFLLESGFTPEYDSVGGSMASVQENWAKLPGEYREAVAAYLKAIPPKESMKADNGGS